MSKHKYCNACKVTHDYGAPCPVCALDARVKALERGRYIYGVQSGAEKPAPTPPVVPPEEA